MDIPLHVNILHCSKVEGDLKTRRAPASRPRRRPVSAAKKLPLLEESVILQAARVQALQQVCYSFVQVNRSYVY